MNGYILNFAVYAMAMVGFFVLTVFIYKKSLGFNTDNKNREYLKVENSLRLSATKTIYVIKAGSEKFLIAGDVSNTTMLSKLDNTENFEEFYENKNHKNVKELTPLKSLAKRINRG